MATRKRRALGPSGLVGAWYDLKAETDKVSGRLSGMVVQAERLRERLEKEYGIAVPSLAVVIASTGERALLETVPARAKDAGGTQLPMSDEQQAQILAGTFVPPRQGPIPGSEAGAQADDTVAKVRAEAVVPGSDPNEFAASIAATFTGIRQGLRG